jgi:hypothetical protein
MADEPREIHIADVLCGANELVAVFRPEHIIAIAASGTREGI